MTKATTPEQPNNTRLWDELGKTDPAATKKITGKRFGGTAVKPMWINKRLTEAFGPCGIGWGMDKPEFTTIEGKDGQVLVYCTVAVWYFEKGNNGQSPARAYGVGGDHVIKAESKGLFFDDEAFKKAYTDALGNAWKFVGVAADIHMGLFDDSKYVQDLEQEFAAERDSLGKRLDHMIERIQSTDDIKVLVTEVLPDVKLLGAELIAAKRDAEKNILNGEYNMRKGRLMPALEGEPSEPADQT